MPTGLKLRHAAALGLAQGPAELLPVSSSAHTILIPFLLGWPYAQLDPGERKAFEVALHAGTALALAIDMHRELVVELQRLDRSRAAVIALSLAPPALVGAALAEPIERRLSGPRGAAWGLATGAAAMALADWRQAARERRPHGGARTVAGSFARARTRAHTRSRRAFKLAPTARRTFKLFPTVQPGRRAGDARAGDGLALGLAQAAALIPGVSRSGATLSAARARGFARGDAAKLSWHAALPVMCGAVLLKGVQLALGGSCSAREPPPPHEPASTPKPASAPEPASTSEPAPPHEPAAALEQEPARAFHLSRAALGVGAASAFASTSTALRTLGRERAASRGLLPYSAYRLLLAAVVLRRARREHNGGR